MTGEEAGRTVEQILRGPLGISGRMIQRLTRSRGVTLNSRPAYLGRAVRAGDVVAARVGQRERASLEPVAMPITVLHEDANVLVIDKPAGILVHPTSPRHERTLAHGVAHHLAERGIHARVRPVHRLDRETSGVVVFAKNALAQQRLDRQLEGGTFARTYLAVVEGTITENEGSIDLPIGRSRDDPRVRAVRAGGRPATTRYTVVERFDGATLVRASLETGRTHQIRVHLAAVGHPIVGDVAYGARPDPGIRRVALHAERVRMLDVETGEPIEVSAPPPPDLDALIRSLGPGAARGLG